MQKIYRKINGLRDVNKAVINRRKGEEDEFTWKSGNERSQVQKNIIGHLFFVIFLTRPYIFLG